MNNIQPFWKLLFILSLNIANMLCWVYTVLKECVYPLWTWCSDFYSQLKLKALSLQDRLKQPLAGIYLISLKNGHWAAILLSSLGDVFYQVWHYESSPPDVPAVPAPPAHSCLWVEQAHQQEKVWSITPMLLVLLDSSHMEGACYVTIWPVKDEGNGCPGQGFQMSSNMLVENLSWFFFPNFFNHLVTMSLSALLDVTSGLADQGLCLRCLSLLSKGGCYDDIPMTASQLSEWTPPILDGLGGNWSCSFCQEDGPVVIRQWVYFL